MKECLIMVDFSINMHVIYFCFFQYKFACVSKLLRQFTFLSIQRSYWNVRNAYQIRANKNWSFPMFQNQTCDVPKCLDRINILTSNFYAMKCSEYFFGIKLPAVWYRENMLNISMRKDLISTCWYVPKILEHRMIGFGTLESSNFC